MLHPCALLEDLCGWSGGLYALPTLEPTELSEDMCRRTRSRCWWGESISVPDRRHAMQPSNPPVFNRTSCWSGQGSAGQALTRSTISAPELWPSDPHCPFLALSRAAAASFGAQECPVPEISSVLPDVVLFLPFADIEPRQRRLSVHTDVC